MAESQAANAFFHGALGFQRIFDLRLSAERNSTKPPTGLCDCQISRAEMARGCRRSILATRWFIERSVMKSINQRSEC
jgi:hypothetical protein